MVSRTPPYIYIYICMHAYIPIHVYVEWVGSLLRMHQVFSWQKHEWTSNMMFVFTMNDVRFVGTTDCKTRYVFENTNIDIVSISFPLGALES